MNEEKLINACGNGILKEVQALLESLPTDINWQDDNRWTPLMWASVNGHLDVVRYLICNGADVNIKNNNGETALDLAEKNGCEEVAEFLRIAGARHGHEI